MTGLELLRVTLFFNKQTWRVSVAVVHLLMLVDYERKERLVSGYSKNLSWILPALFFTL